MNLGRVFAASTRRTPDHVAVIEGDLRMTYAEWYGVIRAVAGALKQSGLRSGDHFITVMRNRHEMATLYWACQMLGVIFTPVSWRSTFDEIKYCIEDAEAAAIAFDGASGDAAAQAAALLKIDPRRVIVVADGKGEGVAFGDLLLGSPIAGPEPVDEFSTCLMLYTSGTTGRPKGVPRSHRNELTASISHIAQNQYRQGESCLGVMPLFHTMGIRILLGMAILSGRFVCMPEYSPEGVLKAVSDQRISTLSLVPTMFHDMLRHPNYGSYNLNCLSRVMYAGMTMTPALVERCLEQLKPELFVNYYGSSEIYTFTYCDHLDRKPGCAGRAGMNQIVRVVSPNPDDDIETGVPAGRSGEIVASMDSPEAFKRYWKRLDADAKAIQGRWYRTGDLGRFDEDGELYVVGRVDDMIISGGENIYPEEVEDVLTRSKLIVSCAVVGMPDDRLGTKVVAFVEPSTANLTPGQLDQACLTSGLARFKRPKEYVFVKSIPRSASGKLLRRMLRSGDYERI